MTERRHLGAGAAIATFGQVATLAGAGVTSILVARLLGTAATGTVALVVNLYGILVLIASVGLMNGINYQVASGHWSLRQAFDNIALASVTLGILGSALAIGAYVIGEDSIFKSITWPMMIAVAASVPFGLAGLLCSGIALARERYEAYAVILAGPQVLMMLAAAPLALIWGIEGTAIGLAVAYGLSGILGLTWARRSAGSEPRRGWGFGLGPAFSFGAKSWGSDLLQILNFRFDLFFLNALAATSDVGVYSIAATVTGLTWVLPQGLALAALPRTADLVAADARGELAAGHSEQSDARAGRQSVLLTAGSGVAVLVGLALIPLIYGADFSDAVSLGLIMMPGVLALGVGKVLIAVTLGRGRPGLALYNALITSPVTIALYVILIPSLGSNGAAIASCISYLMTGVLGYFFFRRITGLGVRDALVPERDDVIEYRRVLRLMASYARERLPGRG